MSPLMDRQGTVLQPCHVYGLDSILENMCSQGGPLMTSGR